MVSSSAQDNLYLKIIIRIRLIQYLTCIIIIIIIICSTHDLEVVSKHIFVLVGC